jgi:nucleoside-diphosphate-sugar epimerase
MAGCQRILITGASGFIGACLTRKLISAGHDVHLLLRKTTPSWRLSGLEGKFTIHRADLCDSASVGRAVENCRPEVAYHLAATDAADQTECLTTNVLGTANLLQAMRGLDYQAFVNVGCSAEYGPGTGAFREDDCPQPCTPYGASKAAATLLCQAEAARNKPVTTVRIFCAYGPWEAPTQFVPRVIDCCRQGKNIRVPNDSTRHDFIFVDDVVDLLGLAAADSRAYGRVLNAGTGQAHRLQEVIATVHSLGGEVDANANHVDLAASIPPGSSAIASIERTTVLLDWRPKYDLRAGLAKTWEWRQQSTLVRAAA